MYYNANPSVYIIVIYAITGLDLKERDCLTFDGQIFKVTRQLYVVSVTLVLFKQSPGDFHLSFDGYFLKTARHL